jgi:hypothetical protein
MTMLGAFGCREILKSIPPTASRLFSGKIAVNNSTSASMGRRHWAIGLAMHFPHGRGQNARKRAIALRTENY